MTEEIKIKFGTELKPIQYSWKSQLYNTYIYLFIYARIIIVKLKIDPFNFYFSNFSNSIQSILKQIFFFFIKIRYVYECSRIFF